MRTYSLLQSPLHPPTSTEEGNDMKKQLKYHICPRCKKRIRHFKEHCNYSVILKSCLVCLSKGIKITPNHPQQRLIANARADEAERCIEHCEKAFKEGFEKAKEELKILCSPLKHSEFCKKTGEQYRECALCYFENRLFSLKLPEKKQI